MQTNVNEVHFIIIHNKKQLSVLTVSPFLHINKDTHQHTIHCEKLKYLTLIPLSSPQA